VAGEYMRELESSKTRRMKSMHRRLLLGTSDAERRLHNLCGTTLVIKLSPFRASGKVSNLYQSEYCQPEQRHKMDEIGRSFQPYLSEWPNALRLVLLISWNSVSCLEWTVCNPLILN